MEGLGSIPGRGIKIPQAVWHGQKKKIIIIVRVLTFVHLTKPFQDGSGL